MADPAPVRIRPPFDRIETWIFDLDNCLYPASTGLFALIDERMGAYIRACWASMRSRRGAFRKSISAITAPRWPA
ncbi:hypothetical protein [Sphingomonas kaistensis]|uniref:hypothetical protein n=1 Tax=Sphingomonas kaistensis TaxID=298708 RepID=UPI003CC845E8